MPPPTEKPATAVSRGTSLQIRICREKQYACRVAFCRRSICRGRLQDAPEPVRLFDTAFGRIRIRSLKAAFDSFFDGLNKIGRRFQGVINAAPYRKTVERSSPRNRSSAPALCFGAVLASSPRKTGVPCALFGRNAVLTKPRLRWYTEYKLKRACDRRNKRSTAVEQATAQKPTVWAHAVFAVCPFLF